MEIVNNMPRFEPPSERPDAKRRRLTSLVLQAGLASTAVTLFGVYLLNTYANSNIMGWTADYVIPMGAMLVGAVASSGYGLASWFGGLKIQKKLLYMIVALQCVAYGAAQYIEFRSLGPLFYKSGKPVGFFEYYHYITISTAFIEDGKLGAPVGLWGYGLKFLEVAGFAVSSLFVPGILHAAPYCEACEVYMKTRKLALFPASIADRKIAKSDVEALAAFQAEQKAAQEKGHAHLEHLRKCVADNDAPGLLAYIAAVAPHRKEVNNLPVRIEVKVAHCKSCGAGILKFGALSGQGKQLRLTELSQTNLTPEFVKAITPKS